MYCTWLKPGNHCSPMWVTNNIITSYISWFVSFSGSLKVNPHNFQCDINFWLQTEVIICYHIFLFLLKPTKKTKNYSPLGMSSFQLTFSYFPKVHRKGRSPTVRHRPSPFCQACYVVNSLKNVECGNVWYVWLPIVEHNVQRFGVGLVAVLFKPGGNTVGKWWWKQILGGYSNIFCDFHPDPWGNDPIWLELFKWVETTN